MVFGAFVGHLRAACRCHAEAVGEAGGNPYLTVAAGIESDSRPLAEGGGTSADVHRHIEYLAGEHPHQFALRMPQLIMQAAQNAFHRFALILLHEVGGDAALAEMRGAPSLDEVAALVFVDGGLEDQHFGDGCWCYFHCVGSRWFKWVRCYAVGYRVLSGMGRLATIQALASDSGRSRSRSWIRPAP